MKKIIALLVLAFLITGCAPMQFKPTDANNTSKTTYDQADYICRMEVKEAAKGRWAAGGLLFLMVVAASNDAADRELYASCMGARGYTLVKQP